MKKQIQHVFPPIGTTLVHKTRKKGEKGQKLCAKVVKTDSKFGKGILYDNKIYSTMTGAACAAGKYSVDGWIYWKIQK